MRPKPLIPTRTLMIDPSVGGIPRLHFTGAAEPVAGSKVPASVAGRLPAEPGARLVEARLSARAALPAGCGGLPFGGPLAEAAAVQRDSREAEQTPEQNPRAQDGEEAEGPAEGGAVRLRTRR